MAARGSRAHQPLPQPDLSEHELIGFDASLDELPQMRWLRKRIHSARWATTTSQVLACAEGLGIALLGTFVAAREARLVAVLP